MDLTNRRTSTEMVPEDWRTEYVGGKGLAYRYLAESHAAGIDPLGLGNEIILMTGPLAGTLLPTSSRMAIAAHSPLGGKAACSLVGGGSAAELKFAGYDGIIVSGKASTPVFLYVTDQRVTFERANTLWGKGAHETERTIREKKWTYMARTLTIGPAGENQVPFSCLTADGYRQAGRGGLGAVMGSKNLKAIAIRGQAGLKIADMPGFLGFVQEAWAEANRSDQHRWAGAHGTPHFVELAHAAGLLPSFNFAQGQYGGVEAIGSEAMKARLKASRACVACPLGCGRFTETSDGTAVEGPEYGTIAMMGSNCGLASADGLIRLNRLCDDLGLDTAFTGAALGYAMDSTEKGSRDFGICFGDEERMMEVVGQIARREGIGAELIAATNEWASRFDDGYSPCPPQLSGVETSPMDGLLNNPARNLARECAEEVAAIWDSLIVCNLWQPPLETLAEALSRVTGTATSPEALLRAGTRVVALERSLCDPGLRREGKNADKI